MLLKAEPRGERFIGKYCTGKFWQSVKNQNGDTVDFATEADAIHAAREEWSVHHFNPSGWNMARRERPSRRDENRDGNT